MLCHVLIRVDVILSTKVQRLLNYLHVDVRCTFTSFKATTTFSSKISINELAPVPRKESSVRRSPFESP